MVEGALADKKFLSSIWGLCRRKLETDTCTVLGIELHLAAGLVQHPVEQPPQEHHLETHPSYETRGSTKNIRTGQKPTHSYRIYLLREFMTTPLDG
jgi:hypothetical protein